MDFFPAQKSIFDTVDSMEQYRYSGRIFTSKFFKQFLAVLFSNLTTLIIMTSDGFIVSRFVGADALNSINLLNPFLMVTGAITLLLATGINIVLSKTYGVGSGEAIKKLLRAIAVLTFVFLVAVTAIQIPVSFLMINSYAVGPEIKEMMNSYVVGLIVGNSAAVINNAGAHMMIASGKINSLFKLAVLESALNIILDLVFICGCGMGVAGAGLSTAISCSIRAAITIVVIQKTFRMFPTQKLPCKDEMKAILTNGIPSMAITMLVALSGYAMNAAMTYYVGLEAVTVISVCSFGGTIATMIANSYVQTGNPLVGVFIGSGDWEVAYDVEKRILKICVLTVTAFVAVFAVFPGLLFGFYGINEYSSFQDISVRLYMLRYIPFAFVCCFSTFCVYCGRMKSTIAANAAEAALLVPVFMLLMNASSDLMFLSYAVCAVVSSSILGVILDRAMKSSINDVNMPKGIHFSFYGSQAVEVAGKLREYMLENNVPKNLANRLSLACEETGYYAGIGSDKDPYIFLSVRQSDKTLVVFYLDNGVPTILNKKLKATDLVIGNYNLVESLSSGFVYQTVGGLNNFIIRFDI